MLEETICRLIKENAHALEVLAIYDGEPAVFMQDAASDMDSGWQGAAMYPRIDFELTWAYSADRKENGKLYVNIWCLNESETQPEDIAFGLKDDLSNIFMLDEEVTYCMLWERMDAFDGAGKEPKTVGITICFDVWAFPNQRHGDPDPVACLQGIIKARYPDMQVLEQDALPETFRALDSAPVAYVRRTKVKESSMQLLGAAFLDCSLRIHIIAPGTNVCREVVQNILYLLSYEHRLMLSDGSPFLLDFGGVEANIGADPMQEGQLSITGRYGVQILEPECPKVNEIIIKQEE